MRREAATCPGFAAGTQSQNCWCGDYCTVLDFAIGCTSGRCLADQISCCRDGGRSCSSMVAFGTRTTVRMECSPPRGGSSGLVSSARLGPGIMSRLASSSMADGASGRCGNARLSGVGNGQPPNSCTSWGAGWRARKHIWKCAAACEFKASLVRESLPVGPRPAPSGRAYTYRLVHRESGHGGQRTRVALPTVAMRGRCRRKHLNSTG